MNKVVYKYFLQRVIDQTIQMPVGAEILDIQWQGESIAIWAKVDAVNAWTGLRRFVIVMTGEPFFDDGSYVYRKTLQTPDGLVVHLFERT